MYFRIIFKMAAPLIKISANRLLPSALLLRMLLKEVKFRQHFIYNRVLGRTSSQQYTTSSQLHSNSVLLMQTTGTTLSDRYAHVQCNCLSTANQPVKMNPSETVELVDSSEKFIVRTSFKNAKNRAVEENLRLVNMGRNSNGVFVFKLISGKELFKADMKIRDEKIKLKEGQSGVLDIKELQLTVKITDHDLEFKMKNAKDTLIKGHPIKVKISSGKKFKGNFQNHLNELLDKVKEKIKDAGRLDEGSITTIGENRAVVHIKAIKQNTTEK